MSKKRSLEQKEEKEYKEQPDDIVFMQERVKRAQKLYGRILNTKPNTPERNMLYEEARGMINADETYDKNIKEGKFVLNDIIQYRNAYQNEIDKQQQETSINTTTENKELVEEEQSIEKVINLVIPKKQLKMLTQRPTGALISAVKVKKFKPNKKMLTGKTYYCNLITEMAGM